MSNSEVFSLHSMIRYRLIYIAGFFTLTLIWACAKITSAPQGGPPDETPPVLITEESDQNFQTNFAQSNIKLTFDEWSTLSNPVQEVVISPPLAKPLQFKSRGKEIEVSFAEDEILKDDVTYQINFGKAIRDYAVGNVFENFVFVFSTGDIIDSLRVSGTVFNEITGKPEPGVIIGLYDNMSDSTIYLNKPFYFSRSGQDGKFVLNNLRGDSFQLFALKDANVSYTYDREDEMVGFYRQIIHTADTTNQNLEIFVFDEEDPVRFISRDHPFRGLIKLAFSGEPSDTDIAFLDPDSLEYQANVKGDSLLIWYKGIVPDSSILVLGESLDTVVIKKAKKTFDNQDLGLSNKRPGQVELYDGDSLKLEFERPILSFAPDSITLQDTSGLATNIAGLVDFRTLVLYWPTGTSREYQLTILPKGIQDWYGNFNRDTISLQIRQLDAADLGKIELNFDIPDSASYVLQLMQGESKLRENKIISDSLMVYDRMKPGNYSLRVIEDSDGDGKWSAGRLLQKMSSERIKEIPLEELKKGWDLSIDIDLNKIFDGAEVK